MPKDKIMPRQDVRRQAPVKRPTCSIHVVDLKERARSIMLSIQIDNLPYEAVDNAGEHLKFAANSVLATLDSGKKPQIMYRPTASGRYIMMALVKCRFKECGTVRKTAARILKTHGYTVIGWN